MELTLNNMGSGNPKHQKSKNLKPDHFMELSDKRESHKKYINRPCLKLLPGSLQYWLTISPKSPRIQGTYPMHLH